MLLPTSGVPPGQPSLKKRAFVSNTIFRHMRARLLAVTLVAILVIAPSFRGADTLPASLSDQEFWKLVTDFSEPGGNFVFEMFMSNEETFQEIIPDLLRRVQPGGVYLGVAPEQNFTYIAALRPKMAFIIDIRRENMVQMLMYKAMFEMAPSRADFLSKLFSRSLRSTPLPQANVDQVFGALTPGSGNRQLLAQNVQAIKDRLQKTHGYALTAKDLQTIDYVAGLFFRGGADAHLTTYGTTFRELMRLTDGQGRNRNFLAAESNYQFVREMQQKNLIVPVVGDFAGPKALRAVGRYLQQHSAPVTAFYVSNVEEYIQSPQQMWIAYCRNVAALPLNASSTFIRFGRGGQGSFLGPMQSFAAGCPR
jgi:hypothetical protein